MTDVRLDGKANRTYMPEMAAALSFSASSSAASIAASALRKRRSRLGRRAREHGRLYDPYVAEPAQIPWQEVDPLEPVDGDVSSVLATVDTLRAAWEEFISTVSEDEFAEARQRSLRRHAIETGIIERLYDVDWGVTEALVAEGLVREVAEREGGIDDDAFETISAQFDALEFLAQAAREARPLTVFFVQQLHELITRHQLVYEAVTDRGQRIEVPLSHGRWKSHPNWLERQDGSVLQCTPPEHVQAEMERLVSLFQETEDAHPLTRAAWLHHRFIRIHPFEDGNGRVARALVLLVLLRSDYAPLVVDRHRRDEYLSVLESANAGDLRPLVRLFAQLEIVALRSEIELPTRTAHVGETAIQVAEGFVERLRSIRIGTEEARAAATAAIADEVLARISAELERQSAGLEAAFRRLDDRASAFVRSASPPAEEARWWRIQIINAAKAANFFSNLADGAWWVRLSLRSLAQELRYVVAIQKVGHGETGVLAITVFAELVPPRGGDEEERSLPIPLFTPTSADSVTLTEKESVDDRWEEICHFVERTLAASVAEFSRLLS
jgi:prophage maintenance system killer protein